jgi:hypothetical protein
MNQTDAVVAVGAHGHLLGLRDSNAADDAQDASQRPYD